MMKDEQWLLEEKYGGVRTHEYEVDKKRLAAGEPLGYVIGSQPFLGLNIFLDSKPLIPRPETEWWTEQLLEEIEKREPRGSRATVSKAFFQRSFKRKNLISSLLTRLKVRLGQAARSDGAGGPAGEESFRFLDLCTGSGAIGCAALARLPDAQVYFGEIDPAHEATIVKNIRENNLDASRTHVHIGDLFEPFDNMIFDVIAANPPYVPVTRALDASVADFEPSRALYAGEDGLDIIRRIALSIRHRLAEGGKAWIECDSTHVTAACALFTDQNLSATIRLDQYEKPRVICVEK